MLAFILSVVLSYLSVDFLVVFLESNEVSLQVEGKVSDVLAHFVHISDCLDSILVDIFYNEEFLL
jgi:hypothetical protein